MAVAVVKVATTKLTMVRARCCSVNDNDFELLQDSEEGGLSWAHQRTSLRSRANHSRAEGGHLLVAPCYLVIIPSSRAESGHLLLPAPRGLHYEARHDLVGVRLMVRARVRARARARVRAR
eukprot:scaffold5879_cov81-Phaeocystis_antarctica.AAC.3